jgi:hypothetical protein
MSTDVSAPPVTYGVHSEVGKLRNTVFSGIVDGIQPFTLRPDDRDGSVAVIEETRPFVDVVAGALGIDELRIIETGGDAYATERQQWDSGNNLVAIEPGVVVAYDRNIQPIPSCARPASRSSRSSAPSSAEDEAEATA